MTKYNYKGKYISESLVELCFETAKHNLVDKSYCGNGFTTSFLKIKPSKTYQSNIIIVPNREVILSKREQYLNDHNPDKTKIGFIFGDENKDRISFRDFDVLMFVIDSFVDRIEYVVKHVHLIDKILCDEVHSTLIQSEFRGKLRTFNELIFDYFSSCSIVSVTATPMLFQKVDIRLFKEDIEVKNINVTTHQKKTLERLKNTLKDDSKKVIVATHNARIIAKLKNDKNEVRANFKIGKSLKQSLAEHCSIVEDDRSNLTIISSSGFEGFDVNNGVNDVFIFEDRSQDYSTFYFQNVLQIIGRSRKGVGYIEYSRLPHEKGRKIFDINEMNKVVQSTRISFEKKLTDKNYYYIPKFYDVVHDFENKGIIKNLKLNRLRYELAHEKAEADNNGVRIYREYALQRGFNIIHLNEGTTRIKFIGLTEKTKIKNIKSNINYIRSNEVYEGINPNLTDLERLSDYLRELKKYFRRKYYKELNSYELKGLDIEQFFEDVTTQKEWYIYNFLKSGFEKNKKDNRIKQLIDFYSKEYREKKLKEHKGDRFNKQFIEEVKTFKENIESVLIRLSIAYSQEVVKVPSKKRVWRDYNVFTEISLFVSKDLATAFDLDIIEMDIRSCNPRIIYAYCGLPLPNNFYGKNKENKKAINILLNTLSKHYAVSKGINPIKRKERNIEKMRSFGFNEKVIQFLINTFYDKPTDAVFNWCAYHEEKIINKLKKELIDLFGKNKYGFVRRHDSVLLIKSLDLPLHGKFGGADLPLNGVEAVLNHFMYLGQKGWFVEVENNFDERVFIEGTCIAIEGEKAMYELQNGYITEYHFETIPKIGSKRIFNKKEKEEERLQKINKKVDKITSKLEEQGVLLF